MIDYIRNGVTTGGAARNFVEIPDNSEFYIQYLQQLQKERQDALSKNYELVRGMDLTKIDPRDRGAVINDYNAWKQFAMNPPQSGKRGEYNTWKQQVLMGETELKNRIADIIGTRKNIVDYIDHNKDRLDYDGINEANKWLDGSVVDKDGNIINPNFSSLTIKPEHVYDADGTIGKLVNQNVIKSQQLAQHHRGRDGKTVSVEADVLNSKGLNDAVQNELHYNPEFKNAIDKSYKQFQGLNPDSNVSYDQFLQDRIKHHYPAMSNRDTVLAKEVPAGDGLYTYNYNVKDPNNYVQHININQAKTFAEQQAENLANYHALMRGTQEAIKSGDQAQLDRTSRLWSPVLLGKSLDGNGKDNRVQLTKSPDGTYTIKATGTNEYGMPIKNSYDMSKPESWQALTDQYNNQFHTPTQLKYRIPIEQSDQYNKNIIVPQQPQMPVSDLIPQDDYNVTPQQQQQSIMTNQPAQDNRLMRFGKKLKAGIGLMNFGASTDNQ